MGNLSDWSPQSWKQRHDAHAVEYPDPAQAEAAERKLASLPPLVTSWEVERLREQLGEAEAGRRFVLQGGDCAEMLTDCSSTTIANKLKILLQMSLVLVQSMKMPVVRIGRFAGQYAKPRSKQTESRDVSGARVTLPNYFGDLINRADFTPDARRPDPWLLVSAYQHSATTLNFIRALIDGGFADLHHPEYWDLSFFHNAGLSPQLRAEYEEMMRRLVEGLRFMEALGEARIHELSRVEFFTSHEGLSLLYESAQTKKVPRREGWYDLTTHMPWIGDRTRSPADAHVEFFRGVRNPVGIKVGPLASAQDLREVCNRLNPANERGRIVLITRLGASQVQQRLPGLIEGLQGVSGLWMCDPMHGNTIQTAQGIKTRQFSDILAELEQTIEVHGRSGTRLGGVHFELTGEDVTECVGGASGVTADRLSERYVSVCDPRLNYHQALEMAFLLGRRLGGNAR